VGSAENPSSFRSQDIVKVARGRDPTDEEWGAWFLLIAVFYPKDVDYIPVKWRPTRREIEMGELAVNTTLEKGKGKGKRKSLQADGRKRKAGEEWPAKRGQCVGDEMEEDEESESERERAREREARVKRPKLDSHVNGGKEQNGEDETSDGHRSLWIRIPPASATHHPSSSPLSSLAYPPSPVSTKSTDQTSCFSVEPPPRKFTSVPFPKLFPDIYQLNFKGRTIKAVFIENHHQEPDVHDLSEKKTFFSDEEVEGYMRWLDEYGRKDYMGTPPVVWEWVSAISSPPLKVDAWDISS